MQNNDDFELIGEPIHQENTGSLQAQIKDLQEALEIEKENNNNTNKEFAKKFEEKVKKLEMIISEKTNTEEQLKKEKALIQSLNQEMQKLRMNNSETSSQLQKGNENHEKKLSTLQEQLSASLAQIKQQGEKIMILERELEKKTQEVSILSTHKANEQQLKQAVHNFEVESNKQKVSYDKLNFEFNNYKQLQEKTIKALQQEGIAMIQKLQTEKQKNQDLIQQIELFQKSDSKSKNNNELSTKYEKLLKQVEATEKQNETLKNEIGQLKMQKTSSSIYQKGEDIFIEILNDIKYKLKNTIGIVQNLSALQADYTPEQMQNEFEVLIKELETIKNNCEQ